VPTDEARGGSTEEKEEEEHCQIGKIDQLFKFERTCFILKALIKSSYGPGLRRRVTKLGECSPNGQLFVLGLVF
jgi:hypothetical protein